MKEKYKHGLLWQDHQHEQLLSQISSLNDKRGTTYESEEMQQAISFLEFYVKSHFDLEEYYMNAFDYPKISTHQIKHKQFMHMVSNFKKTHTKENDSSELVTELCTWFKNHIMITDKELAEFIKDKITGC